MRKSDFLRIPSKYSCPKFIIGAVFLFFFLVAEYSTGFLSSIYAYCFVKYDGIAQGVIVSNDLENMARSSNDKLNIGYEYSVNDVDYYGTRVSFLGKTENSKQFSERFPIGKPVTVYFSLDDPEWSVLEKTGLGGGVFKQVLGLLILLGVLFFGLCRKK